ncbi:Lrp/AsnC family transcriptional regulator [Helicovermis profundi]|uniref:Lrp/AsnC family transcriptional regulator n=1 Tax=Helicovermis profundi TaxID=3065157 RepID=A0AAU9E4N7_9FIRM|nr:Lrp/AsnC family transcriptional regulator [Clostridia bacterium S502]
MDQTDYKILDELQKSGRISMKDLGKKVALTSPAVTERVKKLEDAGIISGYSAIIDPKKLNKHVQAIINVDLQVHNHKKFIELAKKEPSIIECHHLTGEDCMQIKVIVSNTEELEELLSRIQSIGSTKTTIILSTPLKNKPILP